MMCAPIAPAPLPVTTVAVCAWCGAKYSPLTSYGIFCTRRCADAEINS